MKVLKDQEYASLKQKADGFDTIVAAVRKADPDTAEQEISAETVVEIINAVSETESDPDAALQSALDTATAGLATANARITELETENANLRESAGDDTGTVKTKTEVSGKEETLADFADEHSGDTSSILDECVKTGLI
ncbi:MAG: DUF1804 family protein [Candidatus Symbiothrix sp.]|jgi:hypothetical protein|nr:DUF1804 family protein [Candidatus Symbiothrix sp.]